MQESRQLVQTLKQCLKSAHLTYADVASNLGLSEASVKRIFSENSFSLQRLESICAMLDMRVSDLCLISERQSNLPRLLERNQEKALAADPDLLKYFYRLLNGWSVQRINRADDLSEPQSIKLLAKLDRLNLIELLPGNRVKLKTAKQIEWHRDGPLWKQYADRVRRDFLEQGFNQPHASILFESGELSPSNYELLRRKLEKLAREYRDMVELDSVLQPEQRQHTAVLLATRPWQFTSLFPEVT